MKKLSNILTAIAFIAIGITACEDRPDVYEFPNDKYFYEIPEVPVTEDYVVGVPLDIKTTTRVSGKYVWVDGSKKQIYSTGTPVFGDYYDMREHPEILQEQMRYGREAGIDFFMISWGGHGLNDTIFQNYESYYQEGDPRIVIRFDPGYRFPKAARDTLMHNALVMDSLMTDFDSLYTAVMLKPYAYKNAQGQPVMALCNFKNQGNITSVNKFTQIMRDKIASHGKGIWMMGELQGGRTSPENYGYRDETTIGVVKPDTISAFDAFFTTDITTDNKDVYDGFYSFLDVNYQYWQERMLKKGKEYIPTIMPAFDNKINTPASNTFVIPRWNEANDSAYILSAQKDTIRYNFSNVVKNPYRQLANVAKRNVGPSRIVMVYNWNSYDNGINLEPTEEFGNDYLRYTKQFFKR
jgi:hypothetical protein